MTGTKKFIIDFDSTFTKVEALDIYPTGRDFECQQGSNL